MIKGFVFFLLATMVGVCAYATSSTQTVPLLKQTVPIGQVIQVPVSIPSASPTPAAGITTHAMSLVGVQFPSALTSTAMTFKVSEDCTNYFALYNSAGQVSYTVAASHYVAINPVDFYGAACILVVLGSSEAGTRSLTAVLKGM